LYIKSLPPRCRSSKRRKAIRVAHALKLPNLRIKRKYTAPLLRHDDRSAIKFPPPTARKDKIFDFEKGFTSLYTPKQIS